MESEERLVYGCGGTGATWMRVATSVGNDAPTQTALNADSAFHATVNGPAAKTNKPKRPAYKGQFRFGKGCPTDASLKKRRSSGRTAPKHPTKTNVSSSLENSPIELTSEDMAWRHEVENLSDFTSTNYVHDTKHSCEYEWAGQHGLAVPVNQGQKASLILRDARCAGSSG